MKTKKTIRQALQETLWKRGLLGLLVLSALCAACTSDPVEGPSVQEERELEIGMSAMAMPCEEDAASVSATRSWSPPTSYYLYDDLYGAASYVNYTSLNNKAIDVFFTQGTEADPIHGRLRYVTSTGLWKLALKVDPESVSSGDYYVYGFIPRDAADNASIAKLPESSTFADGCVLTIHGLQSVASDACVIIGAKEGPDIDHDNGLQAGDFKFHLNTGVSATNYLYLLFDHLCSALSISMKVDEEYHALRTIKLKELSLQSATNDGPTAKKADVTITLTKTTDGSSPIAKDGEGKDLITFTPVGEEKSEGLVFFSAEGMELTNTASWFLSHFLPLGVTKLKLTSIYDVYDKNPSEGHPEGNLVRKDCKATNTIDLTEKISYFTETQRGKRYTINLTIKPTYLYVLSDPDLDKPTVLVN